MFSDGLFHIQSFGGNHQKAADNPFHHQTMLPTPPNRGSTATQQLLPLPLRAM